MSCSSRRIRALVGLTTCLTAALALTGASTALAATTIGELAPGTSPTTTCVAPVSSFELLQPTVGGGSSYVVPPGAAAVTSWSTNAAAVPGQMMKLKLWRKIGDPFTYQVVGHDGARTLVPGTLNTFSVNLPAQPGDVIGLTLVSGSADSACEFASPGNTTLSSGGDPTDGESRPFQPEDLDSRLNLSAVAGSKTSSDFSFGKVKKNKSKGTATLTVNVPGPGEISLSGTGVKPQRSSGGARISKGVEAAGPVKLKIKAKGSKRAKLLSTGKVKVKVKVTYAPNATGGDVPGDPNTEPKKIKLVDIR